MHDLPDDLSPLPPTSERGWIHPSELGPRPAPTPPAPAHRRSTIWGGLVAVMVIGVIGLATIAIAGSGRVAGTTQRLEAPDPLVAANDAVVAVDIRDRSDSRQVTRTSGLSLGSGIVVTSASHLSGASTVRVNDAPATVMLIDSTTDIAVVKTSLALAPARLAGAARLQAGDLLTVASQSTNAHGTIRALRSPTALSAQILIETDIAPSPGVPGSAVLDGSGAVAGIVSSFRTSAGNLIVVPIDTVRDVVDHAGRVGPVTHAALGVTVIPGLTGPEVQSVVADGIAARSGLRPADAITAINGKPALRIATIMTTLEETSAGSTVTLTVLRGGDRLNLQLISEAEPSGR